MKKDLKPVSFSIINNNQEQSGDDDELAAIEELLNGDIDGLPIAEAVDLISEFIPMRELMSLSLFLNFLDFAEFANSRLGKSPSPKISYGDVLNALIIRATLGRFTELHESLDDLEFAEMAQQAEDTIHEGLRLPHIGDLDKHPNLIKDTFVALANYGCTKFLDELVALFCEKVSIDHSKFKPTSVMLSVVTALTYPEVQTLLEQVSSGKSKKKPLARSAVFLQKNAIKQGVFQPADTQLQAKPYEETVNGTMSYVQELLRGEQLVPPTNAKPQIHVLGTLCANLASFPLTNILIPQKTPAPLPCVDVVQQLLSKIVTTFPSVKYVFGHEALCSAEAITCVRQLGMNLVIAFPNNRKEAKALINQYPQFKDRLEFLEEEEDGHVTYGYVQQGEICGEPVNFLLLNSHKKLNSSKTFGTKAKSEQKKITAKLKNKFFSVDDFLATVSKLQAQAKYCKIELKDENLAAALEGIANTSTNKRSARSAKVKTKVKVSEATSLHDLARETESLTSSTNTTATTAIVTPKFKVTISEDMKDLAWFKRGCNVFICTDLTCKSAADCAKPLKELVNWSPIWKTFPKLRFVLPSKYLLKDPKCSEGILTLMMLIVTLNKMVDLIPISSDKEQDEDE